MNYWYMLDITEKDVGTIYAVEVYRQGGFKNHLDKYQQVFKNKAEAQKHVNSLSSLRIFDSLPNLYCERQPFEIAWETKEPVYARIVEIHISQSCAKLNGCSFKIDVSDFSQCSPNSKKYHFIRVYQDGKHLTKYDRKVRGSYNDAISCMPSLRNLLGSSVEIGILSVNLGGIDEYIAYRKDGVFNSVNSSSTDNTTLETFSNPLGIFAIIVFFIILLVVFNQ